MCLYVQYKIFYSINNYKRRGEKCKNWILYQLLRLSVCSSDTLLSRQIQRWIWRVTPCSVVEIYRLFGETFCFHFQTRNCNHTSQPHILILIFNPIFKNNFNIILIVLDLRWVCSLNVSGIWYVSNPPCLSFIKTPKHQAPRYVIFSCLPVLHRS